MNNRIRYKTCVCCQTNPVPLRYKSVKYCKNCRRYIKRIIHKNLSVNTNSTKRTLIGIEKRINKSLDLAK